ncbi:conserved hypothetical protein [Perkinsus marinus ATCC 50983]|uniref:Methyltransferase domain-containing protein n=1 Tax=Perkinsus marinus (strain ATCC 50983 / TXsc) TaxID=423536 RepID=C5K5G7_PERM5|nr:conserved hypothetical protein [Perkinsus marinus ATCC 50983]EER20283.1 conserved hypothetical protein [Perkinsus marinus ATCC 50983]|eukprot:XP_002788487.1 conserved hypothetical protein [Perkinsus marinus ATCC 50983]
MYYVMWAPCASICLARAQVQAVLQRPKLFMVSEKQWRKLLSHSKLKLENSTSDVSCLDIGAGCGDLTVGFMNLFKANNVTATEVSKMMCRRLSQKGIRAVRTADPILPEVSPTLKKFDAVFCLNVLDR